LDKDEYDDVEVYENEVSIIRTRDSGPGGQHRNVTDSCVIITHLATGIKAKEAGKDQHKNKREAMKQITKKVNHFYRTGHIADEVEERREQIGAGSRSDKRRTYRVKDGVVIDHITNKQAKLKDILRGKINKLS
jgi:peptide chain release factor 1